MKTPSNKHFQAIEDPTLSEAMQQGLKSLELEGIILPDEAVEDLRLLDEGKMTHQEFRARAVARATKSHG
jgi:hypothetical protein